MKTLEKRLTEVAVSPLPVVSGGTALGLAMRGRGGGGRRAGGGRVLVGPIGDGAGSNPGQGQATCGASFTALLPVGSGIKEGGVEVHGAWQVKWLVAAIQNSHHKQTSMKYFVNFLGHFKPIQRILGLCSLLNPSLRLNQY